MKLPKDKRKITKRQYRDTVCRLAKKKSLAELRRDLARIRKKERAAIDRGDRTTADQLDVMERIASDAVFEREFGPVICTRPKRRKRR